MYVCHNVGLSSGPLGTSRVMICCIRSPVGSRTPASTAAASRCWSQTSYLCSCAWSRARTAPHRTLELRWFVSKTASIGSFLEAILEAQLHLGIDYFSKGTSSSYFSAHSWYGQALCFHGLPACWIQYQQSGRKVHPAHYLQHFRQPRIVGLLACYSSRKEI